MIKLERSDLARLVRELDEAPALIKWLKDSRDELLKMLVAAGPSEVQGLQGQIRTIDQVLDKDPDKG